MGNSDIYFYANEETGTGVELVDTFIAAHNAASGLSMGDVQIAALLQLYYDVTGDATYALTPTKEDFSAMMYIKPYTPVSDSVVSLSAYALNLIDPTTWITNWINSPIASVDEVLFLEADNALGTEGEDDDTAGFTITSNYYRLFNSNIEMNPSASNIPFGCVDRVASNKRTYMYWSVSSTRVGGSVGRAALSQSGSDVPSAGAIELMDVDSASRQRIYTDNGDLQLNKIASASIVMDFESGVGGYVERTTAPAIVNHNNGDNSVNFEMKGDIIMSDTMRSCAYDAIARYNANVVTGGRRGVDAMKFIRAAGVTGARQLEQIELLITGAKGALTPNGTNVWAKWLAVWPYCPTDDTTASLDGFKWNLMNPLDTDAAHRMEWYNSPTIAITGISGDGSSAYGSTNFNASTDIGTNRFGLYVNLTEQNTNSEAEVGAIKNSGTYDGCEIVPYFSGALDASFVGRPAHISTQTNRIGLIGAQHDGTNLKRSRDGVVYDDSVEPEGTAQNITLKTLCRSFGGSNISHTTKEQNFLAITLPLTDDEMEDQAWLVARFNANITPTGR